MNRLIKYQAKQIVHGWTKEERELFLIKPVVPLIFELPHYEEHLLKQDLAEAITEEIERRSPTAEWKAVG